MARIVLNDLLCCKKAICTVTLRRARDEDRRFSGEKNVIGRREYIMSKPDGATEPGAKRSPLREHAVTVNI
jgi:hypothetical protein